MASKTLNQIKAGLLAFAKGHGQINHARFCTPAMDTTDTEVQYPAMLIYYLKGRKERSELVMDFSVFIADRVRPERDNEPDVWNDTLLIGTDLLSFLDGEDGYTLQDGSPINPFTESGADGVSGNEVLFTLRVPFPYDRCIIPNRPQPPYIQTEDGFTITTETNIPLSAE